MSVYRKKVFPLRLPQNYHGNQKPIKYLRQIQLQKSLHKQPNPQLSNPKIVDWQVKRNNRWIAHQRREFLVHTGKISHDTPFWFQTTSNFYKREEAKSLKVKQNPNQNKKYDVFGRKRLSLSDRIINNNLKDFGDQRIEKRSQIIEKNNSWNVAGKIGSQTYSRTTSIHFYKNDITPKIGSIQQRDYSIKKPQLKVGKSQFINTYSPF